MMKHPYGLWSFRSHPWLKGMHDSKAIMNIGQKAAQMGYTETALNFVFFKIDIENTDCLYVLPAKNPDAGDFSAARFDAALELSPHLENLFSDVKNVGHKRAGSVNLYIRGSKSRSGLKSVPVGAIVFDEVDEMKQENIPLAMERESGHEVKQTWKISTPTIDNFGINRDFQSSTEEFFTFQCTSCNRFITLDYPGSIEITGDDLDDPRINDSFIKCKDCDAKLDHRDKSEWLSTGIWVPNYENRDNRGFGINQLYSSTITPVEFAKSALAAYQDPAEEQEFYNSKCGLPHIVEGARVTDIQLEECTKSYKKSDMSRGLMTLGIDVGRWLHYEIDNWIIPNGVTSTDLSVNAKCRVVMEGKCIHFEELDVLMRDFQISMAVIDANPERRKAREFADRFFGHVKMCFYARGINGKEINISEDKFKLGGDEPTIMVNRTAWLDLSLGRFRNKSISLPQDTTQEYKRHIKALVRVYEKDPDGNPIGRYVKGNDEDHFAHARNYAEIALPLAATLGTSQDIQSIL